MLPELLTHCEFKPSDERWEAGRGAFTQHVPPMPNAKMELPAVHVSKWDTGLIVALVDIAGFQLGKPSRPARSAEASPVPQPIIVREEDVVHGPDESLSCHVSVSHSDCGKANYRWLNVPFFFSSLSAFWWTARPYTELKGRNVDCQMEAATNCSSQIPPFSLAGHSHQLFLR